MGLLTRNLFCTIGLYTNSGRFWVLAYRLPIQVNISSELFRFGGKLFRTGTCGWGFGGTAEHRKRWRFKGFTGIELGRRAGTHSARARSSEIVPGVATGSDA